MACGEEGEDWNQEETKKTRLDGVDEVRREGGWLKQILNGQPQADIAFL